MAEPAHRIEAASAPDLRLICPLDVPDRAAAEAMVERIGDAVGFYKIGLELLATGGMGFAGDLRRGGRRTFCDWKLHDIGEQVKRATAAIASTGACDFLTVHAEPQVMAAAVAGKAGDHQVKLLAVTVMTSLGEDDLRAIGYELSVRELVERRIRQALDAGVDGVVASPYEAVDSGKPIRQTRDVDLPLATAHFYYHAGWADKLAYAGFGSAASAPVRQRMIEARKATPADALRAGATHLVCGRPITAANDPRAAALAITQEMAGL